MFGHIEPFQGVDAEWPAYLERVKRVLRVNGVPVSKQRSINIACCGSKTYALLRDLLMPPISEDSPAPSFVVQRFHFNSWTRHNEESVSDFVASLGSLSEHRTMRFVTTLFSE